MSSIHPAVRHSVSELLKSLDGVRLGEQEPDWIVERRRINAISVASFIQYGDQDNLHTGDIALFELALATIKLCENPLPRCGHPRLCVGHE